MAINNTSWDSILGSPSNWSYGAAGNRMVNNVTGHVIDMSGAITSNNTWTSTFPTTSTESAELKALREVISLTQQVAEYDALRLYLGANHKEILVEFDVAYAARKRIGVEESND